MFLLDVLFAQITNTQFMLFSEQNLVNTLLTCVCAFVVYNNLPYSQRYIDGKSNTFLVTFWAFKQCIF